MRIIHVVTLFTPDGAFGGPTRVAINQTRELLERGHDVTLAGAASGYGKTLPTTVDGVPVRLFPARRLIPRTGFAGLTSPRLLAWLGRRTNHVDLMHIHLARDLVTLPAAVVAAVSRTPYVLQPHGMVDAPSNAMASTLDVLATRRVLERARTILCLTELEEDQVAGLSAHQLPTEILPNGVPIALTEANPSQIEVLFLARLHSRKRPTTFVQAAIHLAKTRPGVIFSLVGPDEGEGPAITQQLRDNDQPPQIRQEGALDPGQTLERLRASSIYVLPAVNEPFPMSVLEAMSVGKPVIVTNTCGLAEFIRQTHSGIVIDDSVESLQAAITVLLDDDALRNTMGTNALAAVRTRYGMDNIAERLIGFYEGASVG